MVYSTKLLHEWNPDLAVVLFVYYSDGYHSNGDVGLEEFFHREEAEEFIAKRMASDDDRNLEQYIVIEGVRLKLRTAEVVKVIRLDDA